MAWVNLAPEDFGLVTWYDNSTFCKPRSESTYQEILGKIGAAPEECIMVGNSVSEDMSAGTLGMDVFLANEFVENPDSRDYSGYRQGSLDDSGTIHSGEQVNYPGKTFPQCQNLCIEIYRLMGYNFNIPRGEIHQEVKIMFNFFKACSFDQPLR